MTYQLVTCPETAHLEMIEYEALPIGMLIMECSRFRPPTCLGCARTCAARFDRRGRDTGELEPADAVPDAADAVPLEADDGGSITATVTVAPSSELSL